MFSYMPLNGSINLIKVRLWSKTVGEVCDDLSEQETINIFRYSLYFVDAINFLLDVKHLGTKKDV